MDSFKPPPESSSSNERLQLMRPALLAPFVQALDELEVDATNLLAGYQLDRQAVEDNRGLISGGHVHAFLADAARASHRPQLSWHIGEQLEHWDYSLLQDSLQGSCSIGDFLIQLVGATDQHATATSYHLNIDHHYSRFWELRHYTTGDGSHAEAFTAGLLYSLLRRSVTGQWRSRQLLLEVSKPELIPHRVPANVAVAPVGVAVRITLPTRWLREKLPQAPAALTASMRSVEKPIQLQRYLIQMLQQYLHDPELDSTRAARLCGLPLRALNRTLALENSSIAKLIRDQRLSLAARLLRDSTASISEVASTVGYRDIASFSRAFGRWAGVAPGRFRANPDQYSLKQSN